MLYPLVFHPRFKERPWGGRRLADLYGKALPEGAAIGESWEISDREGDESIVANGPLAGRSLRWVMAHHGRELLCGAGDPVARFPVLCKILDARERLSLQVHPPAHRAAALGGEPKTEMWYIAEADPGAELYVGLKRGVTREDFERAVAAGTVDACFHRIPVAAGDAMFLPSGRVHAIGAGLVIFEIQQNSDTTYRVFDWNRKGLDGKPRELHVAQSLASIDFADYEPSLVNAPAVERGDISTRALVRHALFDVDVWHARTSGTSQLEPGRARIVAVPRGRAVVTAGGVHVPLNAGAFVLIPAVLDGATVAFEADSGLLVVAAAAHGA